MARAQLLRVVLQSAEQSKAMITAATVRAVQGFGSEIIFSLCKANGIAVTILEESPAKSFELELSTDVIELMTVFSAKLYGRRSHKNKMAVAV